VNLTHQVFSWLDGSKASAVTSTLTMLELLVHPYRQSDQDRIDGFYALLSTYPHLEWIATTLDVADCAARLRAQHNLKTPDAIQAATALTSKVSGLISNDPAFSRVSGLETIILDDLLPEAE
jgi:predicted nucleic acid-binding protein